MDSNVPATTGEPALPAISDQRATQAPAPRPRQNVVTGLFPLFLGMLVLAFLALAFWTLMTATGSGI